MAKTTEDLVKQLEKEIEFATNWVKDVEKGKESSGDTMNGYIRGRRDGLRSVLNRITEQ